MTTIRQDAWSTDEDLILAEVVLRHIREGSTQLAAFEEVGQRLSRTNAACGFRWNSAIRKKYESAIALAKKQRAKGKAVEVTTVVNQAYEDAEWKEERPTLSEEQGAAVVQSQLETPALTMEHVIEFLAEYHKEHGTQVKKELVTQLEQENEALTKRVEKLEREKQIIAEDYKALIGIMDRARQLSFYEQDNKSVAQSSK
ncbi:RsfA family transcriptional regulator [Bacillus sp. FJAT-45037]|uniref:RsfA family transcriptional regulator n=1 Tax=Bacillus sp. FJAT-45037 TaxID=2011007 RepID=UPI000C250DD8|nr:RsfA family transcriptional regulator [Bacillus sp. FJAT-45037]